MKNAECKMKNAKSVSISPLDVSPSVSSVSSVVKYVFFIRVYLCQSVVNIFLCVLCG
jgi:hypothetical protein